MCQKAMSSGAGAGAGAEAGAVAGSVKKNSRSRSRPKTGRLRNPANHKVITRLSDSDPTTRIFRKMVLNKLKKVRNIGLEHVDLLFQVKKNIYMYIYHKVHLGD